MAPPAGQGHVDTVSLGARGVTARATGGARSAPAPVSPPPSTAAFAGGRGLLHPPGRGTSAPPVGSPAAAPAVALAALAERPPCSNSPPHRRPRRLLWGSSAHRADARLYRPSGRPRLHRIWHPRLPAGGPPSPPLAPLAAAGASVSEAPSTVAGKATRTATPWSSARSPSAREGRTRAPP